jgi:DNA polymerase III sliding clamp (beta) subunit (PCNA family)
LKQRENFFRSGGEQVKFRCDRDDLSEALQTVQRGVSNRPGIPALTGVHLEASDDGSLVLTTTDLEVSARLVTPVQVTEPGIALVPARLLGDMVKSLPEAPVEFDADSGQARIRCAAYEGTVRLLPAGRNRVGSVSPSTRRGSARRCRRSGGRRRRTRPGRR